MTIGTCAGYAIVCKNSAATSFVQTVEVGLLLVPEAEDAGELLSHDGEHRFGSSLAS